MTIRRMQDILEMIQNHKNQVRLAKKRHKKKPVLTFEWFEREAAK